jgi:hypothetical protein
VASPRVFPKGDPRRLDLRRHGHFNPRSKSAP